MSLNRRTTLYSCYLDNVEFGGDKTTRNNPIFMFTKVEAITNLLSGIAI